MTDNYEAFADHALNLRDTYFTPNPIDTEQFLRDCLIFGRKYSVLAAKHVTSETYRVFGVRDDSPLIMPNPSKAGIFSFLSRKTLFHQANGMVDACRAVIEQEEIDAYATTVAVASFHAVFRNHLKTINATETDYELILHTSAWLVSHSVILA